MIFPGLVLCVRKIFFPRIPGEGFHHKNNNTYIYTKIYWEFIIIHIQTDDVTSQFFFILFFYKRVDKKINRRKDFHFLIVVVVYFVGIVLHLDEILFFLW